MNLNQGTGGNLLLVPGLYSFMFHSIAVGNYTGNGIRTFSLPNSTGTVLASNPGSLELIGQASKTSAFLATITNDRVPRRMEIQYTAIPEPSGVVLIGFALVACIPRRRGKLVSAKLG